MLEMAFQSFQISKFSGGACPHTPPKLRGLIHTVAYSSLTSCLLQILLKPLGHADVWRPVCCAQGLICKPYLLALFLDCLIVTVMLIAVF